MEILAQTIVFGVMIGIWGRVFVALQNSGEVFEFVFRFTEWIVPGEPVKPTAYGLNEFGQYFYTGVHESITDDLTILGRRGDGLFEFETKNPVEEFVWNPPKARFKRLRNAIVKWLSCPKCHSGIVTILSYPALFAYEPLHHFYAVTLAIFVGFYLENRL